MLHTFSKETSRCYALPNGEIKPKSMGSGREGVKQIRDEEIPWGNGEGRAREKSWPTLKLFEGPGKHFQRGHRTEHLMFLDVGRENCTYPGKCWGWSRQ